MKSKPDICYLCGKALAGSELDDDHVPARQFYSREIRQKQNLSQLLTLPTHQLCNRSYSLDEEYFTHAFAPIASESPTGNSLWREIADKYLRGKKTSLLDRSLREVQAKPSGLYLPGNAAIRRFDPQQVWRVIWKITRGLYFHHYSEFLPEDTNRSYDLVSPGHQPPREFEIVRNQPSQGTYPTVFDYKYTKFTKPMDFHVWAMLFWDQIIFIIYFHDPHCVCELCIKKKVAPVP